MTVSRVQMSTARLSQTHAGKETPLQNSYTGFHENSTNGWGADTRSGADGRTWSPHMTFFVLTHSRPTTHETGFNWLHTRIEAGFCKHGNEHSVPWKADNVLALDDYLLCFKNASLQRETWLHELDGIQQVLYMYNWAHIGKNWNMSSERICEHQTFRYSIYSHYSSAVEVH